jgi:hypothetical protein
MHQVQQSGSGFAFTGDAGHTSPAGAPEKGLMRFTGQPEGMAGRAALIDFINEGIG